MHDTERHAVVEGDHSVCPAHKDMLSRGEFYTIAGLIFATISLAASMAYCNTATSDSVDYVASNLQGLKAQLLEEKRERKDLADQWREDFRILREDIKEEFKDLKSGK